MRGALCASEGARRAAGNGRGRTTTGDPFSKQVQMRITRNKPSMGTPRGDRARSRRKPRRWKAPTGPLQPRDPPTISEMLTPLILIAAVTPSRRAGTRPGPRCSGCSSAGARPRCTSCRCASSRWSTAASWDAPSWPISSEASPRRPSRRWTRSTSSRRAPTSSSESPRSRAHRPRAPTCASGTVALAAWRSCSTTTASGPARPSSTETAARSTSASATPSSSGPGARRPPSRPPRPTCSPSPPRAPGSARWDGRGVETPLAGDGLARRDGPRWPAARRGLRRRGRSAPLPHRAVATYYGVASSTNEAVLLSWERHEDRPFLTDSLRITPGEDARSSFDTRAGALPVRPRTLGRQAGRAAARGRGIASSPGWQSFRRREVVPREWRDLIVVEAR